MFFGGIQLEAAPFGRLPGSAFKAGKQRLLSRVVSVLTWKKIKLEASPA